MIYGHAELFGIVVGIRKECYPYGILVVGEFIQNTFQLGFGAQAVVLFGQAAVKGAVFKRFAAAAQQACCQ